MTPQQVADKTFGATRFSKGYDETEVDAFLDEVEAELGRLLAENTRLETELAQARAAITQAPSPSPESAEPINPASASASELEELLRRTLLLGQRTADEAVNEAREESERLRTAAAAEAATIRAEAAEHAEERARELEAIEAESERRLAETDRAASLRQSALLAEHDAARQRLEGEIAALRRFESEFRSRLKAYLELQLNDLENAGLEPGPSTDAPPVSLPALPPLPDWMSADAVRPAPVAPAPQLSDEAESTSGTVETADAGAPADVRALNSD